MATTSHTACLLLGSNEGDRMQWIGQALQLLQDSCGTISKRSPVYETEAWGLTEQPAYLNIAIVLLTPYTPLQLLYHIREIENQCGRQRTVKWGQRTLDIDILLYDEDIINLPELTIPHPHLPERRFALLPLSTIAGDTIHPGLNISVKELLQLCIDTSEVKPI